MKNICGVDCIESINDFLDDPELSNSFYEWQSEKANDFINEPDRAKRCYEASFEGCDGSYHYEVIEDFREFGNDLLRESWRLIDNELCNIEGDAEHSVAVREAEEQWDACVTSFDKCCDDLEAWHEANGSLYDQGD